MRLLLLAYLALVAWCSPAAAAGVLAFQRPAVGPSTAIVVARGSDGGAARVIGRGATPAVSPDGRRVAFVQPLAACPRALFAGAACGRLLVADVATGATRQLARYAETPIVWSADSRFLASQDSNQDKTNAQVINLRTGRRHVFAVGAGGFADVVSIAFSPGDGRVLVCANGGGTLTLTLAPTAGGRTRAYGAFDDCSPAWSRYGLAYTATDATRYDAPSYTEVRLRGRTVFRLGPDSDIRLTGWSATGELLAATDDATGTHAVVIDPRGGGAATIWNSAQARIDAISRDATRILAEQSDQILAVDAATGATTLLATDAAAASWSD